MGFHVEINSILRSDDYCDLVVGKTYPFKKSGSRIFFDDIPVWLTKSDWTVQAEISIVSQTRQDNVLSGEFMVDYIYDGDEQKTVSDVFIRMYAGLSDKYIYLLSSQDEYDQAKQTGLLYRDSLDKEGFIHASPKSQLNRVANKYYTNVINPLVITLAKDKIEPEVKWEPATGGLYPHIFGPLNIDAAVETTPINLNENGKFDIQL